VRLDAANWRPEYIQPVGLVCLPKMNPEMSGSEPESSDDDAHARYTGGPADSDDEFPGAMGAAPRDDDDEEEEDDDEALPEEEAEEDEDEDDDEEEAARAGPTLTMHQWLQKPSAVAAQKKKSAAQTKEKAKSNKQKAVRTGSDSAWGAGAASQKGADRPSKPNKPGRPKASAPEQANDDSDDDLASMTMTDLSKPKWPTYPPDAVQEFEDHRAGLSSGVSAGDAEANGLEDALAHMSVHESARERVYIIKNEKVNKWFLFNPDGFVYAPDIRTPESSGLFDFTAEQLTVPSKRERVAMQERLIDAHGTQAMNTVCIARLKTDGAGSGAGPGTATLAMLLPGRKVPPGSEMEDIEAKMKQMGMYDADGPSAKCRKEIVVLMVLDHDLAKRLYKIDQNPLPAAFNPNTNVSTKYKVPSRLEDHAKVDSNFVLIGAAEKARRAGKRSSEDAIANGGEGGGSSRADAKRSANGAAEEAFAMDAARLPHDTPGLAMKVLNGKKVAFSFAELTCAWNETYSVTQVGKGKWVLIKALDA